VIILSFNSLASPEPLAIDDVPGLSNPHSRISLHRSSLAQFLRLLFNFLRLILLLYSYRSVLVLLHFFVLFLNAKPLEDLPELTEHNQEVEIRLAQEVPNASSFELSDVADAKLEDSVEEGVDRDHMDVCEAVVLWKSLDQLIQVKGFGYRPSVPMHCLS